MENININIKAAFIAAILLLITYWYYAGKNGSFVTGSAALIFGGLCLVAWLAVSLVVRLVNYAMVQEWIYPSLLFRILLPFLVMALLFWLVYGIISLPRFSQTLDFMAAVKVFASKHLVYCALCALVIGVLLSLPLPHPTGKEALFASNIKWITVIIGIFMGSSLIFYFTKKIAGPALPADYAQYLSLEQQPRTAHYIIAPFLAADEGQLLDRPYLLTPNNELIINVVYASSNKNRPLAKSIKLNKAGQIVDSLSFSEPHYFEAGYMRSLTNPTLLSWAFDGRTKPQVIAQFKAPSDWKTTALSMDTLALKMVYFQATGALNCPSLPEVKWNGNRYYNLTKQGDTLKFKMDQVYLHPAQPNKCGEQRIEYFECKGMDFDLIRIDETSYYVVAKK